jgi:hypothetical protein
MSNLCSAWPSPGTPRLALAGDPPSPRGYDFLSVNGPPLEAARSRDDTHHLCRISKDFHPVSLPIRPRGHVYNIRDDKDSV